MPLKIAEYNAASVISILQSIKSNRSDVIENETIEFKEYSSEKSLHNDADLVGEISALANYKGGVVIIGVRDGSKIQNKNWNDQLVGFVQIDLINAQERIKGRLQNLINLRIENISFDKKNYLAIFIPKHRTSIVMTTSGKAFIREGRSSRPMTPEEVQHAVKSLQNYDWSSDFISDATDDDFSMEDVEKAHERYCKLRNLSEVPSINGFLEAIEAKKNGLITKGGLLFLGKKESIKKYIGDIEFRFSWKQGVVLKKNEVWSGNLWLSIERAKTYFNSCVSNDDINYNGQKYNVPNLDPDAFHEAFLNAIVHRDYSIDGMVSVEFSGSKLKIISPGTFYGGVNSDNIFFHDPRHRNKALARMLMEYKFVDRAGMGILRMSIKSLVYGRSYPNFEEQKNKICVSMQAEFIRTGIFILTREKSELHVSDLVILNSLYEKGQLSIVEAVDLIKKISTHPWDAISDFIQRWNEFIELCGTKEAIFVCVKSNSKVFFNIQKSFKAPQNSNKYISLFNFLRKHGPSTNEDVSELVNYNHSSTTSRFLSEIEWVERSGKGVASKWTLIRQYL